MGRRMDSHKNTSRSRKMKKQKYKSEMADLVIQIPLVFVHEVHDRQAFQETDGRFLPALRPQAKSNGAMTCGFNIEAAHNQAQSRPWGAVVHVIRLPHPQDPSVNIVRKLSDSKADAIRQAQEELP